MLDECRLFGFLLYRAPCYPNYGILSYQCMGRAINGWFMTKANTGHCRCD